MNQRSMRSNTGCQVRASSLQYATGYRLKMQWMADDSKDNSNTSSSSVWKLDSFQCLDVINLWHVIKGLMN